jgi:thiol:disulfide interchange protein DsbD
MDKIRPDLAKRYQILGYPTILVLDTEGREIKRILGYQSPQEMLRFMNLNQVK